MSVPVLMVAFHFPPLAGSSGIQRTLRFSRHLPEFGYLPLVLTTRALAYETTRDDLLDEIPAEVVVGRALALDCARHLSLFKRYPAAWARPDRWASWRWDGVRLGSQMIRRYRPALIWSSFPIASAHVIAARLAEKFSLPWVADFRDPMAQDGYPADPVTHRLWMTIEHTTLLQAARAVFVTPGAAAHYTARYPEINPRRFALIENGYDEDSFTGIPPPTPTTALNPGKLTLLHSGIVYPSERDPRPLLSALSRLPLDVPPFVVRFRACGNDTWLRGLVAKHGLQGRVEVLPALPYRAALTEMCHADALLVMQAGNCNAQIPAKLYEYFRARRPILALADPAGDTAALMRAAHAPGQTRLANPASADEIGAVLPAFIRDIAHGGAALALQSSVESASRRSRTRALAQVFDDARSSATP